jgi:Ca-activated chloride channel family protein
MKRPVLWVLLLLTATVSTTAGQSLPQVLNSQGQPNSHSPSDPPVLFKSTIDLVSVTAIARDENGRPVKGLRKNDFVVLEKGQPRPIVDFAFSDAGEISLTILFDSSGSMRQPAQLEAGRQVVRHVLSWIKPRVDEVSLYSFDKELRQEVDFTKNPDEIRDALAGLEPMGATSLYDAVAEAARESATRPSPRRAVIVVTDGIDTSSTMTAAEVSSLASSIDVPVYVIAVVNPIDHPGTDTAVGGTAQTQVGTNLTSLAEWTGGGMQIASAPAHISVAARTIVTELRHQYLLAFEASRVPGWYPLEIRAVQKKNVRIRARSGYIAGS